MHDVPDPGVAGGGDGVRGVLQADAGREQEQPVRAGERGRQRGGVAEVGDDPLGGGQAGGPRGVADEHAEPRAAAGQLAGEVASDVPGGAGEQ